MFIVCIPDPDPHGSVLAALRKGSKRTFRSPFLAIDPSTGTAPHPVSGIMRPVYGNLLVEPKPATHKFNCPGQPTFMVGPFI